VIPAAMMAATIARFIRSASLSAVGVTRCSADLAHSKRPALTTAERGKIPHPPLGRRVGERSALSGGWRRPSTGLLYEQMFEDFPGVSARAADQGLGSHREGDALAGNAVGGMMRAVAGGCTPEHLAAVTGFDVEVVKRLLHKPRQDFNGRHPTDRHAPGQERFYR